MPNVPVKLAEIFDGLSNINHGFFGRAGGVSTGKYASLNTGSGSDDNSEHVEENRARVAKSLGTNSAQLLSNHQIHSTHVVVAKSAWGKNERPKADAIVTNIPGLALSALSADCAPILFADSKAGVIGAAHAGWRGALEGVTDETIKAMVGLGAQRKNIVAAVGPCIGPQHFEVGPEFVDAFIFENPDSAELFRKGGGDRSYFDIKTYLVRKLLAVGLGQAVALPSCTYAQNDDYFSYRYNCHNNISDYGRNISVIMINQVL
jgi:purine-nucleoside/S-methyl-5'-thioadenosine phosphorylase / adenosine deaminase